MSEAQEKFLEEYDKRYDRMRNTLFGIVFLVLAALLGSWYIVGRSQGKMEANISEIVTNVIFISKDYTPAWYMQDLTKLFTLHTEKIVAVLNNEKKEEIKKIDDEFKATVEIVQNRFIQLRGGMSTTTRSANATTKGSSTE